MPGKELEFDNGEPRDANDCDHDSLQYGEQCLHCDYVAPLPVPGSVIDE